MFRTLAGNRGFRSRLIRRSWSTRLLCHSPKPTRSCLSNWRSKALDTSLSPCPEFVCATPQSVSANASTPQIRMIIGLLTPQRAFLFQRNSPACTETDGGGVHLVLLGHKRTFSCRIVSWDRTSPRQAHRRDASRHISTAWRAPRGMKTGTRL